MGKFDFFVGNDIELRITSNNIDDFLKTIVSSFKNLVTDKNINPIENRDLVIDVSNENFPIDLFNDLIFLFDRDGFVGDKVDVDIFQDKAYLKIKGEKINRNFVLRILKAATYHDYLFDKDKNKISLKMLIDI